MALWRLIVRYLINEDERKYLYILSAHFPLLAKMLFDRCLQLRREDRILVRAAPFPDAIYLGITKSNETASGVDFIHHKARIHRTASSSFKVIGVMNRDGL